MPLRIRVISENANRLGTAATTEFAGHGGTIGRSLDNDWALPDANRYISSRHAMIDYQSGAYYLVDLSRNGVYVNDSDTPVGQGNPQRLFDGDRMRIGDFEMVVEISAEDENATDDGMQDSIVRAQLVPEDDSVELQLVDADKMIDDEDFEQHLLAGDGSSCVSLISPLADDDGNATFDAERKSVNVLLEAAGLNPKDLAGAVPSEVLQIAGQLLHAMVKGVTSLLHERSELKEVFRISQTIIKPSQNNPLKFSPSVEDALKYLLGDRSQSYLSAEESVDSAFKDIRTHEQAIVKSMLKTLEDYMERFDPDELKGRFDRGLKRSSILSSANKLKYWELYEETYHVLTQHDEGSAPELFSEEFARTYEQEVQSMKLAGKN